LPALADSDGATSGDSLALKEPEGVALELCDVEDDVDSVEVALEERV
jgi:hypothetical protein